MNASAQSVPFDPSAGRKRHGNKKTTWFRVWGLEYRVGEWVPNTKIVVVDYDLCNGYSCLTLSWFKESTLLPLCFSVSFLKLIKTEREEKGTPLIWGLLGNLGFKGLEFPGFSPKH